MSKNTGPEPFSNPQGLLTSLFLHYVAHLPQEKQDPSMTKIHIYPFKNPHELLRCILPNGGMSSTPVPTAHISRTPEPFEILCGFYLARNQQIRRKLHVLTLFHLLIPICLVLGKDALIFREFSRVVLRFEDWNIGIIFVFGGTEVD